MELSAPVDVTTAWAEVRARLRRALGESMYLVWIEPLELASLEERTLVIRAPEATVSWLRRRYGRVLERSVRAVLGDGAQLSFVVREREPTAPGQHRSGLTQDTATGEDSKPPLPALIPPSLNPRYRFEEFIIGDSNQLAHAAALAVAELPGQAYNPLFLYAPPGLGKTHLLHAIGNYAMAFNSGAKVVYTTVEAFTNHFIAALGTRSVDHFKRAYRGADMLLIDDVQFLASKAKTEEEFFHTFNALHESGRQLVLTCDRLPSQLDGVAERLRERFEAGLVADIQPPNFSTRVAILRKRAALDKVPLAEDGVLELIAERVTANVRTLEGALIRVVAFHSLTGQPIDVGLTAHVLDRMNYHPPADSRSEAPTSQATISIEMVQQAVAAHFGLSVPELVSSSRASRIAWPRQLAIHLARELTEEPLTVLGGAFGGRNHATVVHACKRVAGRLAVDQQSAVDVAEIKAEIRRRLGDRPC